MNVRHQLSSSTRGYIRGSSQLLERRDRPLVAGPKPNTKGSAQQRSVMISS